MKIKKLILWVPIIFSFISEVSAAEASAEMKQAMQGVLKFNNMMIECELDYFCLLKSLEGLLKSDANKTEKMFFEFVFNSLNGRKEVITQNYEKCKIKPVQTVKESKLNCLKKLNEEMSKSTDNEKAKLVNDTCMHDQLIPQAKEGNIFAIMLLVEHYEKNKNEKEQAFWMNELTKLEKSLEFSLLDKCFY